MKLKRHKILIAHGSISRYLFQQKRPADISFRVGPFIYIHLAYFTTNLYRIPSYNHQNVFQISMSVFVLNRRDDILGGSHHTANHFHTSSRKRFASF